MPSPNWGGPLKVLGCGLGGIGFGGSPIGHEGLVSRFKVQSQLLTTLFGYSCQLLVVHSSAAFTTDIPCDSKRINKMSSHTFEFLVMGRTISEKVTGAWWPPAAKYFHIILFGMLLRVLFFSFFTFTPFTFITLPDYRHFGRARFNSSTSRSHCLILFLLHLYSLHLLIYRTTAISVFTRPPSFMWAAAFIY